MMKYVIESLMLRKVELLLSLLLATILFNNIIAPILLVLLAIVIIIEKKDLDIKLNQQLVFIILFFVYIIVRELFSFNLNGFSYIFRMLPILLLFVLLGNYNFKHNQTHFISRAIIYINYFFYLLALLVGIFLYVRNYLNSNFIGVNYYQWVIPIKIGFHPPFWGLFVNFGVLIVLLDRRIAQKNRYLFIGTSFFFLLFLSSRTSLLVFILLLIFKLFFDSSIKFFYKIIFCICFFSLTALTAYNSPYLSKKINDNSGIKDRIERWGATVEVFEGVYLFGNSFSKGKVKLKSSYENKNVKRTNYDPHNLFLFFIVNIGLLGIFMFLMTFYGSTNFINMMFLIIMLISVMTETILNRQMGVIIYSIFFSLTVNKSFYKTLNNNYK